MQVPDVSYAQSGDVSIAYQAVSEGPPDLAFLPFLANIYTLWLAPGFAEFGQRRLLRDPEQGSSLDSHVVHDRTDVVHSWSRDGSAADRGQSARRGPVGPPARLHRGVTGIEFEDRGEHDLKGVPGTWRLYAVSSA